MITSPSGSQIPNDRVKWLYIPVSRDNKVIDNTMQRLDQRSDSHDRSSSNADRGSVGLSNPGDNDRTTNDDGNEEVDSPIPRHLITLLPAQDPAMVQYAAQVFRTNGGGDVDKTLGKVSDTVASDITSGLLRYLANSEHGCMREDLLALARGTLDESTATLSSLATSEVMARHVTLVDDRDQGRGKPGKDSPRGEAGMPAGEGEDGGGQKTRQSQRQQPQRYALTSPALAHAIRSQVFDGVVTSNGDSDDEKACGGAGAGSNGSENNLSVAAVSAALMRGNRRDIMRQLASAVLTSKWNGEDSESKRHLRETVEMVIRDHFASVGAHDAGVEHITATSPEAFLKHPIISALARHKSNKGAVKWLSNPENAFKDYLLSADQPYSKYLELLRNRIIKFDDTRGTNGSGDGLNGGGSSGGGGSTILDCDQKRRRRQEEEAELDRLLPPDFGGLMRSLQANEELHEAWSSTLCLW